MLANDFCIIITTKTCNFMPIISPIILSTTNYARNYASIIDIYLGGGDEMWIRMQKETLIRIVVIDLRVVAVYHSVVDRVM